MYWGSRRPKFDGLRAFAVSHLVEPTTQRSIKEPIADRNDRLWKESACEIADVLLDSFWPTDVDLGRPLSEYRLMWKVDNQVVIEESDLALKRA